MDGPQSGALSGTSSRLHAVRLAKENNGTAVLNGIMRLHFFSPRIPKSHPTYVQGLYRHPNFASERLAGLPLQLVVKTVCGEQLSNSSIFFRFRTSAVRHITPGERDRRLNAGFRSRGPNVCLDYISWEQASILYYPKFSSPFRAKWPGERVKTVFVN